MWEMQDSGYETFGYLGAVTVQARFQALFLKGRLTFSIVNRFCMALLCGRSGRLTAQIGGFRSGQYVLDAVIALIPWWKDREETNETIVRSRQPPPMRARICSSGKAGSELLTCKQRALIIGSCCHSGGTKFSGDT